MVAVADLIGRRGSLVPVLGIPERGTFYGLQAFEVQSYAKVSPFVTCGNFGHNPWTTRRVLNVGNLWGHENILGTTNFTTQPV